MKSDDRDSCKQPRGVVQTTASFISHGNAASRETKYRERSLTTVIGQREAALLLGTGVEDEPSSRGGPTEPETEPNQNS